MSGTQSERRVLQTAKNTGDLYGPPLIIPHILLEDDIEEIKRLRKRRVPPVIDDDEEDDEEDDTSDHSCELCYSKDHFYEDCSWVKEIPPGGVIGPWFDEVCIGCGKIGLTCCSKGAYAVRKHCTFCSGTHWFWEDRCKKSLLGPWPNSVWLALKKHIDEEQPLNDYLQALSGEEYRNKEKEEEVMVYDEDKYPAHLREVEESYELDGVRYETIIMHGRPWPGRGC